MSGTLATLARLFLFRDSQQALRDSLAWALFVAALAIGITELLASGEAAVADVLASAAISTFFLVGMTWLILRLAKRDEWFNRTLLGLVAVDLACLILMLPGFYLFAYEERPDDPAMGVLLPTVVWLLSVLIWSLAVKVRLWMYATSRSALACSILVLFLLAAEIAAQFLLPT